MVITTNVGVVFFLRDMPRRCTLVAVLMACLASSRACGFSSWSSFSRAGRFGCGAASVAKLSRRRRGHLGESISARPEEVHRAIHVFFNAVLQSDRFNLRFGIPPGSSLALGGLVVRKAAWRRPFAAM